MVQLYAFANLQPAISPYLYTRILLTIKKKMKQQRLVALDVLRGMTIAGMILVNTPGSWEHVWTPLRHAEWNGLTPTDMVFPSFMFMMVPTCVFSRFTFRNSFPSMNFVILSHTL